MDKNKLIQSKKFFKTFQIKDILENSNFVVFLNNVGVNSEDSFNLKKLLSKEHNLTFTNVKNRPLINSLLKTKYKTILQVFQGNISIIHQSNDTLENSHSNSTTENFISDKGLQKLLFESDTLIPVGFLLHKEIFLTPELFKSLSNRCNDIRGITTIQLLNNPSTNLVNNYLSRSSHDILNVLNQKRLNSVQSS